MAGSVKIDLGEGTFFFTLYNGKKIEETWEINENKVCISLSAYEALQKYDRRLKWKNVKRVGKKNQ